MPRFDSQATTAFLNQRNSMKTHTLVVSIIIALGTASAFAQPVANTVQRDVNQQTRIENGLKNGSLTTKEAGRLEREQAQIDRLQAKDLKDGKLSAAERAQLKRLQDKSSRDIHAAKANAVYGNPESKSSERLQADVQRNVNQEKRIEQGVQSGALTNRETGKLEQGQAKVDRLESKAARDGHVGKHVQAASARKENRQSEKIHDKKHNAAELNG
jgi:hypothetical protein